MTDNDFSAIKPVENLQNVASLTPTGQPQERKRRQNSLRRGQEHERTPPEKDAEQQTPGHDGEPHAIDYCA